MKTLSIPVILAMTLTLGARLASADLPVYLFNSGQTDFNSKFLTTSFGGLLPWNTAGINANGGVNNTGYLEADSVDQTALWSSGYNWATGTELTMSLYFKARVTAGSTGAGEAIRVGIDASNTGVLNGGQYLAFGLEDGTASDNEQLTVTSREGGTTTTKSGTDLGVGTDNNWYEIRAAITKKATAGQFKLVLALYNWGADGVTGGAQVGSSWTLDGTGAAAGLSTLWNDTDAYFGFRAAVATGRGVRGLDNLATIPEPTLLGVLALGGLLLRRKF